MEESSGESMMQFIDEGDLEKLLGAIDTSLEQSARHSGGKCVYLTMIRGVFKIANVQDGGDMLEEVNASLDAAPFGSLLEIDPEDYDMEEIKHAILDNACRFQTMRMAMANAVIFEGGIKAHIGRLQTNGSVVDWFLERCEWLSM